MFWFHRKPKPAEKLRFRIGREHDGQRRWIVYGRTSPIKDWKELGLFESRFAAAVAVAMMWAVERTSVR